jgi:hypothetical protein
MQPPWCGIMTHCGREVCLSLARGEGLRQPAAYTHKWQQQRGRRRGWFLDFIGGRCDDDVDARPCVQGL